MENKEKPAFPLSMEQLREHDNHLYYDAGLTKREYFAGLAMQGYMANQFTPHQDPEYIAEYAIKCADALLSALTVKNTHQL